VTTPTGQGLDHAATVRRVYALIDAGDIDGFVEYLADDFVEHEKNPLFEPTKEGVKQLFQTQIAAFPDLRMNVEDIVASGDKIVARVRVVGTHKGEFMGIPPTGNHVEIELIDMFRFGDDGRVHEHWGVMDALSMMQQLGAIPSGPPA
jgi:steroid delta-isomerase-like uncharacterized protein